MTFYNSWFTLVLGKGSTPFGIKYHRYQNMDDFRDMFYLHLPFFHLSIKLPWASIKGNYANPDWFDYGFEFIRDNDMKHVDCLEVRFGRTLSKYIYLPWHLDWYSTTQYPQEGEPVVTHYKMNYKEREKAWNDWCNMKDDKRNIVVPYTYIRNNGERQNTFAHIHREIREWRWRWLMWLDCKWFKAIRDEVSVEFQDEIGEGVDDWKGGCIGCDYDLKPGENILDALRRMEKERRFN